jgi:putative FmdB family regulatory protein
MPIFEYECTSCTHKFEKIHKFTDRVNPICPKCKIGEGKRIVSANSRQSEQWAETSYTPTPTAKQNMKNFRR